MQFLLVRRWDIIEGKEEEYNKFISDAFARLWKEVGLKPVGGYYVEVGLGPRIVAVAAVDSLVELSDIIMGSPYREHELRLKSLVANYSTAVLEPIGRFREEEYTIQKGVWKLNMSFDAKRGMKAEDADTIMKEHMPPLENLSYVELTGGWNVILGGMSEYVSELTFKDPSDIGKLLKDEEFRKAMLKMRGKYIANYTSRILRCTERFDEPKWFKL